jgi:hypothetical protein
MGVLRPGLLYVFEVGGHWYWWAAAHNGRGIACCPPPGYTRRGNAVRAAQDVFRQTSLAVLYQAPKYLEDNVNRRPAAAPLTTADLLLMLSGTVRK